MPVTRFVLPFLMVALAGSSTGAGAQDFQYDCQNKPVRIAIPGDRLDAALKRLRLVTRCPISGTQLAKGKRSKPVVGMMTPGQGLDAVLAGTGLRGNAIKGGFEISAIKRKR